MHLHNHLKQCIVDFGPVMAFWCFSIERFNGFIADIPTNNINIEVQFMRTIARIPFVKRFVDYSFFSEDFSAIFDNLTSCKYFL